MASLVALAALAALLLGTRDRYTPMPVPLPDAVQAQQLGGRDAPPDRWPFVCYIQAFRSPGQFSYGTGFLIGKDHVLTAGHVVRGHPVGNLVVWVGATSRAPPDGEMRRVRQVTSPYSPTASGSDWAILRLTQSSTKRPVRVDGLNAHVPLSRGMLVWNVGFGRVSGPTPAKRLQENVFRVHDVLPFFVVSSGRGAEPGFPAALRKPCGGDSGSPVLVNVNGEFVAVALNNSSTAGKECVVTADSRATARRTKDVMEQWKDPYAITTGMRARGCGYVGRVTKGRTWRCPSAFPWDAGTTDQGSRTPAGFRGKQCAANRDCAILLNRLYSVGGASVQPVWRSG